MRDRTILATVLLIGGFALTAHAQDTERPAAPPAGTIVSPPSAPPEDEFDWIELKSGEWLKGRIKAMQDRKLEFDSEELDDLEFDWKDIRRVRSPHMNDALFENEETASGPMMITPSR